MRCAGYLGVGMHPLGPGTDQVPPDGACRRPAGASLCQLSGGSDGPGTTVARLELRDLVGVPQRSEPEDARRVPGQSRWQQAR